MTYEQTVLRIEEIISNLSDENVSLDNSLKLFSEGTKLLKDCSQMLNIVRDKAEILSSEGNYEQ